jgi:inorganic triphosphatase YgiF
MQEVELKFQIPEAERDAVARAVAGRNPARREKLVAMYFDTPGRALAQAALALRVRREGGRWVQTLKGAGDDGMTRLEHNIVLPLRSAAPPLPDVARHAGTPAGERLIGLLREHPDEPLQTLYATEVMRQRRQVRRGSAMLELCLDRGRIRADDRESPIHELEIELVKGAPAAVIDEARRWIDRFGVCLDARTKAERGDLLARGLEQAPAQTARGVVLDPTLPVAAARRAVIRTCADQILRNASQLATGGHGPEHVHQLRVGLRRLRSALQLFDARDDADTALRAGAAGLFRSLGAARDADVLRGSFGLALDAALQSAGLESLAGALPVPVASGSAPDAVRAVAAQRFLLDLIESGLETAASADAPADDPNLAVPLREHLARRIGRWHRRAAREAADYAGLDDSHRHELRKRVKRLRYATEFSAALFAPRAVRRYLLPLKNLQECLGEINDVVVALDVVRDARSNAGADPRLAFALGWLSARREALQIQAAPALKAFAKAERFWK